MVLASTVTPSERVRRLEVAHGLGCRQSRKRFLIRRKTDLTVSMWQFLPIALSCPTHAAIPHRALASKPCTVPKRSISPNTGYACFGAFHLAPRVHSCDLRIGIDGANWRAVRAHVALALYASLAPGDAGAWMLRFAARVRSARLRL